MISKFKEKLRNYILRVVKNDEDYGKINFLESKVAYLGKMVSDVYPETYVIDSSLQKKIDVYLAGRKIYPLVNMKIHKNDRMFIYNLHRYKGNFENTFIEYINSGFHQNEVIKNILEKSEKNTKAVKFLDFASGHGRLTRFLFPALSPQHIWVSDTKKDAIDFQKEYFKVNGFMSSFTPEEILSPVNFDMIFVASLFSHLQQDLFVRWLKKLISFLDEKGVLCISVVDSSLYNPDPETDFQYVEYPDYVLNDEMYEVSKDAASKAKDLYGVTYVNENWLKETLGKITGGKAKYYRYSRTLWDLQDIYIITLDTTISYSNIHFEKYIYT